MEDISTSIKKKKKNSVKLSRTYFQELKIKNYNRAKQNLIEKSKQIQKLILATLTLEVRSSRESSKC